MLFLPFVAWFAAFLVTQLAGNQSKDFGDVIVEGGAVMLLSGVYLLRFWTEKRFPRVDVRVTTYGLTVVIVVGAVLIGW